MGDRNEDGGRKIVSDGEFYLFCSTMNTASQTMNTPSHKKSLVVLTGAGISAESGLKTFRDSDGLWEGYEVTEVATPRGWRKDPGLVLDFYNMRRGDVRKGE